MKSLPAPVVSQINKPHRCPFTFEPQTEAPSRFPPPDAASCHMTPPSLTFMWSSEFRSLGRRPRRRQHPPESIAAVNECSPTCNDWVITLFAASTLFWRSGRLHLCSAGNCQAGRRARAAFASCTGELHWKWLCWIVFATGMSNPIKLMILKDVEREEEEGGNSID